MDVDRGMVVTRDNYGKPLRIVGTRTHMMIEVVPEITQQSGAERILQTTKDVANESTEEPRLQGMWILLADDNFTNQQIALALLEAEGAFVQVVNNGKAAVDAIVSTLVTAKPPFDVVLMNLQMPIMDGLTATQQIRNELQQTNLPIIAITSNAVASDIDACITVGMNDYISGSFDLEHLIHILRQQVGWLAVGANGLRP